MTEDIRELEFNSDTRISQRFHDIIDSINYERKRISKTDDYGNPLSTPADLLERINDLYKEISVELSDEENKIKDEIIRPLQTKIISNPPSTKVEGGYWKKTLLDLDDLDLALRKLAKLHGFYAKNKDTKAGKLR